MIKIDFQFDYKKIAFGVSARYTSLLQNIDEVLDTDNIVITVVHPTLGPSSLPTNQRMLNGYEDYRAARMTGDIVFDARLAFNITKESKVSILMNNVLNREYSNRPGNVLPPRTLLWQYSFRF